jgi:hypothetical protein
MGKRRQSKLENGRVPVAAGGSGYFRRIIHEEEAPLRSEPPMNRATRRFLKKKERKEARRGK